MNTQKFYERLANLPREARYFTDVLFNSGAAFFLGSVLQGDENADIDVFVSFDSWHGVARTIPPAATPNKNGGWRFTLEGVTFDVWPDTVARMLTQESCPMVFHPYTNTLIRKRRV